MSLLANDSLLKQMNKDPEGFGECAIHIIIKQNVCILVSQFLKTTACSSHFFCFGYKENQVPHHQQPINDFACPPLLY